MPDTPDTAAFDYRPLDIDGRVYRFEKAFRGGENPAIDDHLTGDGPDLWHLLLELAHSDLELRLRAGQAVCVVDYLARYPGLAHFPNELAALLETEVKFRAQAGHDPQLGEYESRYALLGPRVREAFKRVGTAPPEVPGYEVFEPIAQGGMGVVYRARQILLRREVALKLIRPDRLTGATDADAFRRRFRREAEAVATVNHPHVVQVFETGEHAGDLYLAMELVDGPSLQRRLDADGVLAPRAAAELVEKVARAMHAVHERKIVHRDLKPDNVLLTSAGEPKVVDFGLAKPAEAADGRTRVGVVLGTPEYMSPEQAALTGEEPTPRVDVYGLGAVLYAALTGRPPFPRESVLATLEKVRTQAVLPVRDIRADCPADLQTVCLKCLAKDPARRYATAADLAADLRRWLDGQPILARPVGWAERSGKWVNRSRGLTAFIAVLLTGLSVVAYLFDRARRAEAARREFVVSLPGQADRAMQRGDWADAEAKLNQALAEGHPEPALVRLARARVYFNQGRYAEADGELDYAELVLGANGRAKLLRADMALGIDNEQALKYAREALELNVSPADREYAKGLLSENLLEADAHYQAVLLAEPFHLRAIQLRSWGLLVLGRGDEVRAQLAAARAFFPDDRDLLFLQVTEAAQSGRVAEAEATVRTRFQGDDQKLGVYLVRLFTKVRDVEEFMGDSTARITSLVFELISSAPSQGRADLSTGVGQVNQRMIFPPPVAKLLARLDFMKSRKPVEVMMLMRDQNLDTVATALNNFGEGLAFLVRGRQAERSNDMAAAREFYLKAVTAPSVLNVKRAALAELADAEIALAHTAPDAERKQWAYQATVHIQELYTNGGLPKAGGDDRVKRFIAAVATERKMDSMRRRMIEDFHARSPDNPSARLLRAQSMQEAGAFGPALELYAGMLKFPSTRPQAEAAHEACRKALREQAEKWAR